MELMQVDKKTEAGQIRYITLGSIGAARIQQVPDATVIETLIATGAAE
jgi:3-dehydroquinate synthetase